MSLSQIAELIKSDEYKARTEKGRSYKGKADRNSYKSSKLSYVTFSGRFSQKGDRFLLNRSSFFCVDIDDLTDIETVRKTISLSHLTPALMFISPSGKGLKIVYLIDKLHGSHKQYFSAFQYFFKTEFNLEIDEHCSDISRACFLCYDPECFLSDRPDILSSAFLDTFSCVESVLPEETTVENTSEEDQAAIIERLKVWADKRCKFEEGNRNAYITAVAGACNRVGLTESFVLYNLLEYAEDGFTEQEITATVKSVYGNKSLHGVNTFNTASGDFAEPNTDVAAETPSMPIEGFPVKIQHLIREYCQVYGTHPDLITAAIFSATSAAMGQSVTAKNKYENPVLFWLAVVDVSGGGKTGAYNFAFERLHLIDLKAYREHKNKMDLYLLEVANLKKGTCRIAKPEPCSQHLIIDSTPEALAKAMAANPRGTTLFRDELHGWFQDFGRYSKSGEQQNMLSAWSQTPFKVNRASGDNIFIKDPFLNVFGGIQPGMLPEMAKDGRAVNGFLQRFCFVFPDSVQVPCYSFTELSEKLKNDYTKYIDKLLSLKTYRTPIHLEYDAQEEFADFCNKNASLNNSGLPDYLREVNSKLNIIVKRIALLFHYANWVYAKTPETHISRQTMINAVQMAEYFRITQYKIYKNISQSGTGIDKKVIAKYLSSIGNSQTNIAKVLKVSQQHISNLLNQ